MQSRVETQKNGHAPHKTWTLISERVKGSHSEQGIDQADLSPLTDIPSSAQHILISDVDGALFHGISSTTTLGELIMGGLRLPKSGGTYSKRERSPSVVGVAKELLASAYLEVQKVDEKAVEGIRKFREYGIEKNQEFVFAAVTGRTGKRIAAMTRRVFHDYKLDTIFKKIFFTNLVSTPAFKERTARDLLDANPKRKIIYLEDDLRAALAIARTSSDRVTVFLKRNISNSDALRWWAKIKIPDNVIMVDDFSQAADIYKAKTHAA